MANPGPDDPMYTAGESVMRTYIYTPQPEIEMTLGEGSVCRPMVGSPVNYLVSVGSGDVANELGGEVIENPVPEALRTLQPYPASRPASTRPSR